MGARNFLSIRSEESARQAEGREVEEPFPIRHELATFAAFLLAGALPLLATWSRRSATASSSRPG